MSATTDTGLELTIPEFMDWAVVHDGRWELVDGEPRAIPANTVTHGLLIAASCVEVAKRLETRNSGLAAYLSVAVIPRVRARHNLRVVDLGVGSASGPHDDLALADPVLMVEVLSDINEFETRSNVWAYATIPSVREIVVLKTNRIEAEFLRRQGDGLWPSGPDIVMEGDLRLDAIGLRVPLADLYRSTWLAARRVSA